MSEERQQSEEETDCRLPEKAKFDVVIIPEGLDALKVFNLDQFNGK